MSWQHHEAAGETEEKKDEALRTAQEGEFFGIPMAELPCKPPMSSISIVANMAILPLRSQKTPPPALFTAPIWNRGAPILYLIDTLLAFESNP